MAKAERITYFMSSLNDQPGALLAILKDLKSKKVDLRALWGFGIHGGKATLFLVPENPEKLRRAGQASSQPPEEGTGFFVKGANEPGGLNETLRALAKAGVNLHAVDAIALSGRFGAFIWVAPEDVERASKALGIK